MAGRRVFNITGPCIPALHYMVDTGAKIDRIIREYVDAGEYFTINRPRQYGKTTTLELLRRRLREKYIVIDMSFEGREDYFASLEVFSTGLSMDIAECLAAEEAALASIFEDAVNPNLPLRDLANRITRLCSTAAKEVVLFIDEVDKASNNAVFLSFLGLLRDKYIERSKRNTPTFKSVILAGVHDIKNLKMKLRPEEKHSYNSPWNIATRFDVDLGFSASEIATMLESYEDDYHTGMDIPAVSERLYYYTDGYPFLVSDLCKTIRDDDLAWTCEGVDEAQRRVVKTNNTLFDDVIKNIVNNPSFGALVERILLRGEQVTFEIRNPDIDLGLMYGIFKEDENKIRVSNIIFETLIFNYFISVAETGEIISRYTDQKSLYVKDGRLDMTTVLERFAAFMRTEYRDEDGAFIERQGRLLFLSFLKPIINGGGHYAVEPETRGSRRMDVVVFYDKEEYIVELKIWRGEQAAGNAYGQLAGYLESRGQKQGYLLSFCDNRKSPRENRTFEHNGYLITEVIVAYRDRE